jgi:hypothetical protein
MDRELATKTIDKQVGPATKIEITNDIDDTDVSIRASPAWEEVELVALRKVS